MRKLMLVPVAAFAVLAFIYLPQLPNPMATHFGVDGQPNGFSSPGGFFALGGGVMLLMLAIFGGMGSLLRRLPNSLINIPNRDYWLAPERRAATVGRVADLMAMFGLFVLTFLDVVFYLAIRANLTGEPLDSRFMLPVLGAMGVAVVALLVRMFLGFRLPAGAQKV